MAGSPGGEGRGGTAGRVWVLGADGKPAPITVNLGLSDGTSTEVLRGDVKEGQEVIVGSAGAGGRGTQPPPGAPRLPRSAGPPPPSSPPRSPRATTPRPPPLTPPLAAPAAMSAR